MTNGRKTTYEERIEIVAFCVANKDDYQESATKDNEPMEGFWGTLNCKMYYLQKFYTYKELRQAIDEYIIFYNTKRLQKNLKDLTPIEYRNQILA